MRWHRMIIPYQSLRPEFKIATNKFELPVQEFHDSFIIKDFYGPKIGTILK